MNENLKLAIESYIKTAEDISSDNNGMKEIKMRQKQCKEHIISYMINNKMGFIDIGNGLYLVLKKKHTKPQLNEEFLSHAFKEFYKQHNRLNVKGDVNAVGNKFGTYVIALQKHMASTSDILQITKKRPIASILLEDFKI